jgi:short-subunit dehydrogenase
MSLPAPDPNATVVVTGASSGIGAELAREISRRGHHVTLVARRRDRLEELARELRQADARPADLADDGSRGELLGALRQTGRFVAGLCNNAGFGTFGKLWELDPEREREEVRLNVVALHDLTLEVLPTMVQRGEGAILNVGSIAGAQPIPGNATYAASKAFVNSFSEALHTELRGSGVSCTVVMPGPVRTEFMDVVGAPELEARAPGFTWDSPGDVARTAVDGMARGKRVVVPSAVARILAATGRFTPRAIGLPLTRAAYARRPASDDG